MIFDRFYVTDDYSHINSCKFFPAHSDFLMICASHGSFLYSISQQESLQFIPKEGLLGIHSYGEYYVIITDLTVSLWQFDSSQWYIHCEIPIAFGKKQVFCEIADFSFLIDRIIIYSRSMWILTIVIQRDKLFVAGMTKQLDSVPINCSFSQGMIAFSTIDGKVCITESTSSSLFASTHENEKSPSSPNEKSPVSPNEKPPVSPNENSSVSTNVKSSLPLDEKPQLSTPPRRRIEKSKSFYSVPVNKYNEPQMNEIKQTYNNSILIHSTLDLTSSRVYDIPNTELSDNPKVEEEHQSRALHINQSPKVKQIRTSSYSNIPNFLSSPNQEDRNLKSSTPISNKFTSRLLLSQSQKIKFF